MQKITKNLKKLVRKYGDGLFTRVVIIILILMIFPLNELIERSDIPLLDEQLTQFLFFFLFWIILGMSISYLYIYLRLRLDDVPFQKVITFSILLICGYLSFFSLKSIYMDGLFTSDSCGKQFNDAFFEAARNGDISFCFNKNLKIKWYQEFASIYCRAPNEHYISEFRREFDCVSSLASYTSKPQYCSFLNDSDLRYKSEKPKMVFWSESSCLEQFRE